MDDKKAAELEAIGASAAESIADMVAALECDYDRLAELREELEAFGESLGERLEELQEERDDDDAGADAWRAANPDAARELAELEALAELERTDKPTARAALAARWAVENPDEAEELAELEAAAGDCDDADDARERILEDPLSLRIFGERTDGEWEATSFELLLATGGPAVRILGDIDHHGEPSSPRLEVQDWFTPWRQYFDVDASTLDAYCSCFYFGE
ncbi:hypothetical protein [Botrimarina mediterranea]|uniref:Uncharacterized protein n=1 Tax=Botrimarina mediterranea TaxID=2528022 RepID=A0A518KD51_9BACT|nr:hypothetical protein [Botrimarina mediterranea]QDV75730.1 hypothetical protein Spa11_39510 [Botrimarina mediterranea]